MSSKKISVDDFSTLKVIGKGSYGKVLLVEKIDDKKVYAMKILKKKAMIKRNQVNHIKTERRIMEFIDHPFIVKLRYAFQTSQKLYLIMDYQDIIQALTIIKFCATIQILILEIPLKNLILNMIPFLFRF